MILRIAFKNLLHKPLYAVLCWLLLACSTAVLLLLITLSRQAKEQLEKQIDGVDMVLGAKGSPLQLILSSVYNIDAPTGNIYLEEAQRFMQHPLVESAIPVSLGDSYMGYRIIGTTDAYLKKYNLQPVSGKVFSKAMEVVVGATVAQRSQLKIGSKFAGTHGLGEKGHVHEEHSYIVTGILPPTGLSVDQLILTSLQSVWEIHETHHEEHEDHEAVKQQITAVLIKFKSPLAQLQMPRMVNENTNMQAAVPAIEINRLQSLMGSGTAVLRILGWLLAALATCSIFVMLVQGTHERRYELALLRSMGYGRGKLLGLVLAEAAILGITGILGGFLLSRLSGWFLQQEVFSHYHLNFSGAWKITPADMLTGIAILAACLLAALFPAIRAFRLNISKTLANA
ncbi:ABC transporter permease [Chitinophaga niabensis]|uniref:ABC transporter permease n=1 Tax=Chitinophaga niabensis TaxID=536979 RepID=UPI0031BB88E8